MNAQFTRLVVCLSRHEVTSHVNAAYAAPSILSDHKTSIPQSFSSLVNHICEHPPSDDLHHGDFRCR